MSKYTACPVCGDPKKKKWNLCRDCLKIYGGTADDWPEWLRSQMNHIWRSDKTEKQISLNEEPLNDFESYIDQYWDTTEVLRTRPPDESRIITDSYGRVSMAYAPYGDDEDMNISYRKTNGIPEDLDAQVIAIF